MVHPQEHYSKNALKFSYPSSEIHLLSGFCKFSRKFQFFFCTHLSLYPVLRVKTFATKYDPSVTAALGVLEQTVLNVLKNCFEKCV